MTARYFTSQKALEITTLAQLNGKVEEFSEQPATDSSVANANIEITRFCFGMLHCRHLKLRTHKCVCI